MQVDGADIAASGANPSPPSEPQQLQTRARIVIVLLGLVLVAALLSMWSGSRELDVVDRIIDGERVSLQEISDVDRFATVTGTLYTIAAVLAAVAFLLWFSRAYRNVRALGVRNPRWGTRWAVAYWFIPIVNLFRPKQVVNDIWRGSDPRLGSALVDWAELRVPALLQFWWAAWLISMFAANYATRALFSSGLDPTPEELRDEVTAFLVSDGIDVVAAVLAILVVRSITARQEERRATFHRGELWGPTSEPESSDTPALSAQPTNG